MEENNSMLMRDTFKEKRIQRIGKDGLGKLNICEKKLRIVDKNCETP